jgi:hypothetical protein
MGAKQKQLAGRGRSGSRSENEVLDIRFASLVRSEKSDPSLPNLGRLAPIPEMTRVFHSTGSAKVNRQHEHMSCVLRLAGLSLVCDSRCPWSTASGQFLNRPAMAFGEFYECVEVVLSFTRPQKNVRSKEFHVGDLRQLHGRRPEASRNK